MREMKRFHSGLWEKRLKRMLSGNVRITMGKRGNGNYRKIHAGEQKPFSVQVRAWIANIYLLLMLGFYPLFQVDGYMDLVYRKWAMLLRVTAAAVAVSLLWTLPDIITRMRGRNAVPVRGSRAHEGKSKAPGMKSKVSGMKKWNKPDWLPVDWFVAGYFICVLISYFAAVDRQAAFWGVDTWYTGFVSQLLFIGIYFMISRGYLGMPYLDVVSAAAAVIVGGIVILQRFGVDALHLYDGFGDDVKLEFVTTLGQVTWTSSYVTILLIAGTGIYFLTAEEEKSRKIFWGICTGIGFAMEMVLNCDSGVIALCAAIMIMAWIAVGSREKTLRLMEILMIALLSAAVTGMAERLFAKRMIPIDAVYLKVAQSMFLYPVLAAVAFLYFLIKKGKMNVEGSPKSVHIIRGIYLGLLLLGIGAAAVLFVLHGKGYFAGSPTENYFRFTVWWGNSRGFIWRSGAAVFMDFGIGRKLFGCGPDGFTPYAYRLMGDAINEFWHNQIVPNVHNEWFNAVINYGLVGGTAYLGIFVSAAWLYMKKAIASPMAGKMRAVLFGCGLAAAGYIVHNVLCYQQIIGTPVIFILIGIGAAKIRQEKNI